MVRCSSVALPPAWLEVPGSKEIRSACGRDEIGGDCVRVIGRVGDVCGSEFYDVDV